MTNSEFSDLFATMLNSYATKAEFGDVASRQEITLNEYEKSSFLTQAQDIIIKSYFEGADGLTGKGFDDSERRQVDFSSLIKIAELKQVASGSSDESDGPITFDERGIVYELPKKMAGGKEVDGTTDVLIILNERLIYRDENETKVFVIKPISYREYDRLMSQAFSFPLKKQAWRLFQNQNSGFDVKTELIPRFNLDGADPAENFTYRIRYVRRPRPIILEDLPDGLTIDGESKESSCELNPIIHTDILAKAVELAYTTRVPKQPKQNGENRNNND